MNFNFRVGLGLRQNIYGGALVLDDVASTPEVEYVAVESFFEEGIESTVVASVRLPGWIVYSTDVELFVPAEYTPFGFGRPSASWRNTLSFRLTRNLSLNGFANVDIEPMVIDKAQTQLSLLLRASWAIF
jgi:hypothetical protein